MLFRATRVLAVLVDADGLRPRRLLCGAGRNTDVGAQPLYTGRSPPPMISHAWAASRAWPSMSLYSPARAPIALLRSWTMLPRGQGPRVAPYAIAHARTRMRAHKQGMDKRIRNPDSAGIRKPETGIRNPESGIRNPECGIRNPESGIRIPPESGIRNPESGIRIPESGIRTR